jgi:hypothetical protein
VQNGIVAICVVSLCIVGCEVGSNSAPKPKEGKNGAHYFREKIKSSNGDEVYEVFREVTKDSDGSWINHGELKVERKPVLKVGLGATTLEATEEFTAECHNGQLVNLTWRNKDRDTWEYKFSGPGRPTTKTKLYSGANSSGRAGDWEAVSANEQSIGTLRSVIQNGWK